MKLLAIIFVAAISISSVLPFGVAKSYKCPNGYRKEDTNCRKVVNARHCPAGAGTNQGDRCVIESKYCPLGYTLQDNNQMCEMVNSSGTCRCEKGYILNKETGGCEKVLKRKPIRLHCGSYLMPVGDKCVGVKLPAEKVCPDRSDTHKGCRPVKFEKKHPYWCTKMGAISDPDDPLSCIYEKPGSVWCPPKNYTYNEETNMCQSDKVTPWFPICQKSEQRIEGGERKCFVLDRKKAECTCSPDGSSTSVEKPILACFEGTMDEEVCAITKPVQPVLECPSGFSIDETNTLCLSERTIAAVFE